MLLLEMCHKQNTKRTVVGHGPIQNEGKVHHLQTQAQQRSEHVSARVTVYGSHRVPELRIGLPSSRPLLCGQAASALCRGYIQGHSLVKHIYYCVSCDHLTVLPLVKDYTQIHSCVYYIMI